MRQMLASSRRWCIRFAPSEGCFKYKLRTMPHERDPALVENEVALIGLRDILRRACFPNYRYAEAKGDKSMPSFASQRMPTGLRAPHHGAMRGRDVHEQLAVFVNQGEARWRVHYGYNCNAYVPRIVSFLSSNKLRPVVAEFEDFILDLHIGTSTDIVCINEKSHTISLIELKIGGENYFEKSNAPLIAPPSLTRLGNSPRNQALCQLLFERAMFTRNYPFVPMGDCYVMLVRTGDIVMYGLTAQFIDAQEDLVATLSERRRRDRETPRWATASRGRGAKRALPVSEPEARSSRARWQ